MCFMIRDDWCLQDYFVIFFFLFGVISVQIKYYVVTSRKVKLNHVSVKLFASCIDEMWGESLEMFLVGMEMKCQEDWSCHLLECAKNDK